MKRLFFLNYNLHFFIFLEREKDFFSVSLTLNNDSLKLLPVLHLRRFVVVKKCGYESL